ncbi:transposase [Leucobacter chromiiresistens]|uniref:transposase n=1 Tax=Leucobacter chromiiresistens TaxID=1079994 RepID=UPI0015A2C65D
MQQQSDADGKGRPRTRPDRVLADKGYPSKANRAWLRDRGIAATISERDNQIAHRRNKPGQPIDFGHQQSATSAETSSSNASTSSSNGRGIAMSFDKTARNYRAAASFAATLIWMKADLSRPA